MSDLDRAFEDLKLDWENDDMHRRFLMRANLLDGLGEAARLYRAQGDDPIATKQVQAIVNLAMTKLQASPREAFEMTPRQRFEYLAWGLAAVLLIAALAAMLRS